MSEENTNPTTGENENPTTTEPTSTEQSGSTQQSGTTAQQSSGGCENCGQSTGTATHACPHCYIPGVQGSIRWETAVEVLVAGGMTDEERRKLAGIQEGATRNSAGDGLAEDENGAIGLSEETKEKINKKDDGEQWNPVESSEPAEPASPNRTSGLASNRTWLSI